MLPGQSNRHHGVPRSFTGEDDEVWNLTVVDEMEHGKYHQMSGHLPPDFLIREIVATSGSYRDASGHKLPLSFTHDVLKMLLPFDWRSLYVPQAVKKPQENGSDRDLFARSAIHVHNHIHKEISTVSNAIRLLTYRTPLPNHLRIFNSNFRKFFGEENPAQAIRSLLIAKTENNDLKWVKPMQPSLRSNLLDATLRARPEALSQKSRRKMNQLFHDYHGVLINRLDIWQPLPNDYLPVIEERATEPFYQEYLLQRTA